MSRDLRPRVIALAGLLQSLKLVRQMADTGHVDGGQQRAVLDSVFRIDAPSASGVYGGVEQVRTGLRLLRDYLSNSPGDPSLPKLGMAVMQIERKFSGDDALADALLRGLRALDANAQQHGSVHPDVIHRLGQLYAEHISPLRPKVIVHGNPHYLQQAGVVAEIRALLLAALRAAVLWRQMGGTLWDFVFSRRAMLATADELLG